MVCIRSEHAIGFLKGHFQSLKNLWVSINSKKGHILTTYWVAACIWIHSFAMQCKEKERSLKNSDLGANFEDPFIAEDLSLSSDQEVTVLPPVVSNAAPAHLWAGKVHCENPPSRHSFFVPRSTRYDVGHIHKLSTMGPQWTQSQTLHSRLIVNYNYLITVVPYAWKVKIIQVKANA